jgi:hypothetical protein
VHSNIANVYLKKIKMMTIETMGEQGVIRLPGIAIDRRLVLPSNTHPVIDIKSSSRVIVATPVGVMIQL